MAKTNKQTLKVQCIEQTSPFDTDRFKAAVKELFAASGIAEDCAHIQQTPDRVAELWQHRLLNGYNDSPEDILGSGFEDPREDLVIIRDISIHGVCPHHLLPFKGVAHVAYLPGGRLHGFGRIARLVDAIGHRFTYQEWMTHDIAKALVLHGKAQGAACIIEAEQLCLLLGENRRGGERVITQAFAGNFESNSSLKREFIHAISSSTSR